MTPGIDSEPAHMQQVSDMLADELDQFVVGVCSPDRSRIRRVRRA
jgi:hypothetical protein